MNSKARDQTKAGGWLSSTRWGLGKAEGEAGGQDMYEVTNMVGTSV